MEIESAPIGELLRKEIDLQTLKFKPEEIKQPYKELFDESYCGVCFGFHDFVSNRTVPFSERGKPIFSHFIINHSEKGLK